MNKKIGLALVLVLLAVMAFAVSVNAQTGVGWETIGYFKRLLVSIDSNQYPGLQIVQSGDADALQLTGDLEMDGDVLDITGGDVTLNAESTGGNAGAKNQFIGLPRITAAGLLAGTNGTTESTAYIDTTPTGEWAEIDSGTAVAVTADTTTYRATTNSVKIAFTAAYTVGDGVDGTISQDDLSGNESIGFYLRSSVDTSAGDYKLTLDDTNGTDQSYDVPAVTADTWTWVEIDISACNANCDTVDGIKFTSALSESLNLGAHNVWLDAMYKWDSADEEALGQAIVQDGVLFILASPVVSSSINTTSLLTEWTDYIVNYQTGNDVVVWLSDQSANANTAFIAY